MWQKIYSGLVLLVLCALEMPVADSAADSEEYQGSE